MLYVPSKLWYVYTAILASIGGPSKAQCVNNRVCGSELFSLPSSRHSCLLHNHTLTTFHGPLASAKPNQICWIFPNMDKRSSAMWRLSCESWQRMCVWYAWSWLAVHGSKPLSLLYRLTHLYRLTPLPYIYIVNFGLEL